MPPPNPRTAVSAVQRTTLRFIDEPHRRYRTSKLIGRLGAITGIVLIMLIWGPAPDGVVTILSVVGAGLAIANREAILSLAGRLNIALRAPYVQGDRIEVNGIIGDVNAGLTLLEATPSLFSALEANIQRTYQTIAKQKGKQDEPRIRLEWPPLESGGDGAAVADPELLLVRRDAA